MKLIFPTQRVWTYRRSPVWMWHQGSIFVRALASAGDRNPTPKVTYWLAWIKKKHRTGAFDMSEGRNSTDATENPAFGISCCALIWATFIRRWALPCSKQMAAARSVLDLHGYRVIAIIPPTPLFWTGSQSYLQTSHCGQGNCSTLWFAWFGPSTWLWCQR